MVTSTSDRVHYDNYDPAIVANPHGVMTRLREEAPLYYNAERDFYALSRWEDVEKGLVNRETFISGRGATLDLIRSGRPMPRGTVLFEDPPIHTFHRALVARMFTPKKMNSLEDQVREIVAGILDPKVAEGGFDFAVDLGLNIPMRVIGMLLGIPYDEQTAFRDYFHDVAAKVDDEGNSRGTGEALFNPQLFAHYVDWRAENPSDDVTTEVMNAEFEDENGVRRTMTRDELLTCIGILAAAGSDTTGRLFGWTGKVLADHPDQRRELVANPALIPNAIDEVLRYEPPALQTCRYVARDTEHYGQVVPEGSAMLFMFAAANRDPRRHENPDVFDVHRKVSHMSLGFGPHFCIGAPLARLEARIVLEEVLKRFPDWEVDTDRVKPHLSSEVRGWERLPVVVA